MKDRIKVVGEINGIENEGIKLAGEKNMNSLYQGFLNVCC